MADKDEGHVIGGRVVHPGQEGAEALANRLVWPCRSVKIVLPLKGKDVRAWVQADATADLIRLLVRNTSRHAVSTPIGPVKRIVSAAADCG
jgi:hypothetical protein